MVAIALRRRERPAVLLPAWRRRFLLVFLLSGFIILLGRSIYLQALQTDFLQRKGDARYARTLTLQAHRGMITDRNGEPLAISTPVESVWASPSDVTMSNKQLGMLSDLIELTPAKIKNKISNHKREFVYLKRRMAPDDAARVMQLKIPGIFTQREYRRFYPSGDATAHLIGFTNIEDRGLEAMELSYNDWLSGKTGSRRVIKDGQGNIIEDQEAVKVPQDGHDLVLSIDRKIQYLAYRELAKAVHRHKAKAGSVIVLDTQTGEVLALANLPSYNPNNLNSIAGRIRNRAIVDTFEPGSTIKPFTVLSALETGKIEQDSVFDVGQGTYPVGKHIIHDEHTKGMMTVGEIIQKSSNIGVVKIGMAMSPKELWSTFNQLGFGVLPQSGFPGEATGRLRPWKKWRSIEHATMCFGQGLSLSLFQIARAYSVFANDGELKPLSLTKQEEPVTGPQVFSAKAARQVREMMELVVEPGGTAPKAWVPGYRVAGKTGTAQKVEKGVYVKGRYIASFIGMAPASNPRLIVAVMVDEPSVGGYFGGVVAAPAFSKVMAGTLRMLAVPQDAPNNHVVIPENVKEVGESV